MRHSCLSNGMLRRITLGWRHQKEQISGMRHAPVWPMLEALGPTLAYDHIGVMGDTAAVPIARAAHLTMPVLVISGGASYPFMSKTALALSKAFPNGRLRALAGQTHDVNPETLAPVLVNFFVTIDVTGKASHRKRR